MRSSLKFVYRYIDVLSAQWLLIVSIVGVIGTSLYLHQFPCLAGEDLQIIFILAVLFIAVKGLERSGVLAWLSQKIERGAFLPVKLVCVTFFLSMVVTNDVALLVMVPLTLALNTDRKDILVIFEALAANTGSALTPFGNPQNLFIYWYYQLDPQAFISTIAPFSLLFLVLLVLASFCIQLRNDTAPQYPSCRPGRTAFIYLLLLTIVVLTVLRVLPVQVGIVVVAYAVLFDRKSLAIDYSLLFTLICFFIISENMKGILAFRLEHSSHIFLSAAFASQVISNVPAALLFSKFTTRWQALLWGTNVGGFGSLIGSLANVIAYKLYQSHDDTKNYAAFTVKFLIYGYIAFFIGIWMYFLLQE
ncbi:hypothetical protein MNBD_DELTA04-315 [hydrothermal vent metagenome]|uniref:Citrate transporter-like domain-containing protein n=1 Tax=hydrothermal vent metagenome TaxID=652676 RepID=A0A3B0V8Q1_9ZZZZ